eukprot:GILJ01000997.1.p1 GENE.GILJ01000997.1~~GILJ01000997.1.p1  ORF type:complete len:475 (-),score=76.98 GILJ01000997.1:155-1510(-)
MEIDDQNLDAVPKPKKTQDFSKEVAALLPQAQALAKAGRLQEAIDLCMGLEKQTRQAGDSQSTSELVGTVAQMCFDAQDWTRLNENIVLITKKRGQSKRAVVDLVQKCSNALPNLPNLDIRLQLIDTLRTVTAGKIFVEVERARLTRTLAQIKEGEGNIAEAADLMQEVQVETYGAMEKREKTEYILEQMRLVLLKKDYIRTFIISRKLNKKILQDANFQDLKVRYYNYLIEYFQHENKPLDVCKCWQAIYETPIVKEHVGQWQTALQNSILYLALSPFNNEQSDLLARISDTEAKRLQQLPIIESLAKQFMTMELMNWPLTQESVLLTAEPFQGPKGPDRWKDLHKRVIQHNIRVIAQYYSRITMSRLASLLNLDTDRAELELSEMVSGKFLSAKIDRPQGVIMFVKRKEAEDILNEWSSDISSLLDLAEKTCHLIHKENMVHKVTAAAH